MGNVLNGYTVILGGSGIGHTKCRTFTHHAPREHHRSEQPFVWNVIHTVGLTASRFSLIVRGHFAPLLLKVGPPIIPEMGKWSCRYKEHDGQPLLKQLAADGYGAARIVAQGLDLLRRRRVF